MKLAFLSFLLGGIVFFGLGEIAPTAPIYGDWTWDMIPYVVGLVCWIGAIVSGLLVVLA